MAKAVLISIRPRWTGLILSGEKTLELRRTRPNLTPPFKCYVYCSMGRKPWVRKHVTNRGCFLLYRLEGGTNQWTHRNKLFRGYCIFLPRVVK